MPVGWWVAESHPDGTRDGASEVFLNPGPSYVRYPAERLPFTMHRSAGRAIKQYSGQHPTADYAWVWQNRSSHPEYWSKLFKLQDHLLVAAGKNPRVWVHESTTGELGKYDPVSGMILPAWIAVNVVYVGRSMQQHGGPVIYPESEFRFTIQDPTYVAV